MPVADSDRPKNPDGQLKTKGAGIARSITVEIRASATNAVERPLEEISAARSRPFALTISSANLLSLCRSRKLKEPLVSVFLSCIRACGRSRAGASPLESQFGSCPDG